VGNDVAGNPIGESQSCQTTSNSMQYFCILSNAPPARLITTTIITKVALVPADCPYKLIVTKEIAPKNFLLPSLGDTSWLKFKINGFIQCSALSKRAPS